MRYSSQSFGWSKELVQLTRIMAPTIRGIVETCINVSDISRARRFYEGTFGFDVMKHDDRFCAFQVGPDVLLLFMQGGSDDPIAITGGLIPPHNTLGAGHFAFAVFADELESWRQILRDRGIQIESEITWELGGHSIYFRDPDGNLLELVSPGAWANY
jgi:catechol 2,3-dioxygenase-like lactoylglutathione lyase family enzyme